MYRIILFLALIALAAAGAAWVADQTGDVVLSSGGWRVETSLPVFALALGVTVVAAMLAWSMLRGLWRTPQRIKRARRERRHAAAVTPSPTACSRSATAIPSRPACMPMPRAAMRPTIRWRCCCTRNPHSSTATAKARESPSAPWAEREDTRLLACAVCSSKRSAPTIRSPPS